MLFSCIVLKKRDQNQWKRGWSEEVKQNKSTVAACDLINKLLNQIIFNKSQASPKYQFMKEKNMIYSMEGEKGVRRVLHLWKGPDKSDYQTKASFSY